MDTANNKSNNEKQEVVNKTWNTHAPDDGSGVGEPWDENQLAYINDFKTEKSFINYVLDDVNAGELKNILGKANFSNLRNKYKRPQPAAPSDDRDLDNRKVGVKLVISNLNLFSVNGNKFCGRYPFPGRPESLDSIFVRKIYKDIINDIVLNLKQLSHSKYFGIFGSPGTGKSLLLYCICYKLRKLYPHCRIIWSHGRTSTDDQFPAPLFTVEDGPVKPTHTFNFCDDHKLQSGAGSSYTANFISMSGVPYSDFLIKLGNTIRYYMSPWSLSETKDCCAQLGYKNLEKQIHSIYETVGPVARALFDDPLCKYQFDLARSKKESTRELLDGLDSNQLKLIVQENIKASQGVTKGSGSLIIINESSQGIHKRGDYGFASPYIAYEIARRAIKLKCNLVNRFLRGDLESCQFISSLGTELFEAYSIYELYKGGQFNCTLLERHKKNGSFKFEITPHDVENDFLPTCLSFEECLHKFMNNNEENFFRTWKGAPLADAIFIKMRPNPQSKGSVYFLNAYYPLSKDPEANHGHKFSKVGSEMAHKTFAKKDWDLFFVQVVPCSSTLKIGYPTETSNSTVAAISRFTMYKLNIELDYITPSLDDDKVDSDIDEVNNNSKKRKKTKKHK